MKIILEDNDFYLHIEDKQISLCNTQEEHKKLVNFLETVVTDFKEFKEETKGK